LGQNGHILILTASLDYKSVLKHPSDTSINPHNTSQTYKFTHFALSSPFLCISCTSGELLLYSIPNNSLVYNLTSLYPSKGISYSFLSLCSAPTYLSFSLHIPSTLPSFSPTSELNLSRYYSTYKGVLRLPEDKIQPKVIQGWKSENLIGVTVDGSGVWEVGEQSISYWVEGYKVRRKVTEGNIVWFWLGDEEVVVGIEGGRLAKYYFGATPLQFWRKEYEVDLGLGEIKKIDWFSKEKSFIIVGVEEGDALDVYIYIENE
jgi:hypothetical protein